jgi:hypothetical protein
MCFAVIFDGGERKMKQRGVLSHVCERDFCCPKKDPTKDNVYVCKFGAEHVCSGHEACELASISEHGEWVCPLSGLVFGVDDDEPAMYRTADGELVPLGWKLIKPSAKRRKVGDGATTTTEPIAQRARIVVEALFFGRARANINHAHNTKQAARRKQMIRRYVQEQTRDKRFISMPHLSCIDANTVGMAPPYVILDEDAPKSKAHVDQCVNVIVQVWDKLVIPLYAIGKHACVTEAATRPHMDQCIFGVLALMVVGHELIHYDTWVAKHLPREQDMAEFGISQVKRKLAKNVIARFYELSKQYGIFPTIEPLKKDKPLATADFLVFRPVSRGKFCAQCRVRTPCRCKK